MMATRIIPCLDVDDGRVVKGVKFRELQDTGDPVELARYYNDQSADELVFLDIGASHKSREIMLHVVEQVSLEVFIPLTVGGGIRSVEDMRAVLNAGADKVAICTSAIRNPGLIRNGARQFGSQCIVLSIDAKKDDDGWFAYTHGGRRNSGLDAVEWAQRVEELGAGEILLNSIDMDGTQSGYDLELIRTVSQNAGIPVIASGGAGTLQHVSQAVRAGRADAVLLASLLHFERLTIVDIKVHLQKNGVTVRW
ncbi:MAG: imidazole glycerol phosphate synthase subunit HisF [bacterium]